MKPTSRLLSLLGAWTLLALAACLWPRQVMPAWQLAGLVLAGLAGLDALLLFRQPPPALDRRLPGILPVGAWTQVPVRLSNGSPMPLRVRFFDGVPATMDTRHLPQELDLDGQGWAELGYALRPSRRGPFQFQPGHLLMATPLGLWWKQTRPGPAQAVKVYPNFAPVKKYAALALSQRLDQLGIHRRRRRGEGSEFHQLRDFREGDSTRQVDWKATARMGRLISKDYQEERDQQVVLLLDCGRRMRTRDGRLSHFDHTLTALLLLAYVALGEGDAVGLLTFAGAPRWVAPGKSRASLDRLQAALYDLEPSLTATDYLDAAQATLSRLRKRSLVVLITNLRDEDDETLAPALRLLRQRHRVVLASLREPELDQALQQPVKTLAQALQAGAVHSYLDDRRKAFQRLDPRGTLALDVRPDQLAVALVNRYLAVKRSGEL